MALRPGDPSALHFQDDLTELFNRRYLLTYLESQVEWKKPEIKTAVLLIDFDGFQKVNDTWGVAAGDDALRQFAARLAAAVSPVDIIGRYGGDSFLVVFPGRDAAAGVALAEKLRADLASKPLTTPKDRLPISVTFSAGAATAPDHGAAPDSLIDAVSAAVYVSKKSGRNRTSVAGQLDREIVSQRGTFATLPCPLYAGRQTELAAATSLLNDLKEKRPCLLFVQGEAGSGKSRFLRELAGRARGAGLLYLYVACSETRKHVSAYALSALINRYYAARPDEQAYLRSRLNAPQRAVMRETVDAFTAWKNEGVIPNLRDRRLLTLQATETAVLAMTDKAPLLILVDNAAHCDRGTLDILRVILRDRKAAIGVLFAFKGDVRALDAKRDAALAEFVHEFEQQQRMETLSLAPLPAGDLAGMIDAILPGAALPEGFAQTLSTASRGNPLYVEEAIRALILGGRIKRTAVGWSVSPIGRHELPASLDDVIKTVLDKLPEGASDVITNAAVLGSQFDVNTLQEVMGQREAQMQDAVDNTRGTGLIRQALDGSRDELEFSADHTRNVRYASAKDETKKKVHRRVSDVLRVRNIGVPGRTDGGGGGGEGVAGELDFHAAAAEGRELGPSADDGGLGPGTGTGSGGGPSRQARIPESAAPLAEGATKKAYDFLRALTGLLKVGRLYPQWSQTGENFKGALNTAAAALLAESPTVTLTVDTSGLRINGQPQDSMRVVELAGEVSALLADRLIGSLTFKAGLDARELAALTAALAQRFDKSTALQDHWDRFLDREEIRNFDILQRRYVSRTGETMRIGNQIVTERPLMPDELETLWASLRFLKAGVDNLKLYPPGHALVEQAMNEAASTFQSLLGRAGQVTLSAPEGALIVNSVPADTRPAAEASALLADELKKKAFQSLTLSQGLDADEVRALVSLLSVADVKTAQDIAAGNDMRHVIFNIRSYARVAGAEVSSAGGMGDGPPGAGTGGGYGGSGAPGGSRGGAYGGVPGGAGRGGPGVGTGGGGAGTATADEGYETAGGGFFTVDPIASMASVPASRIDLRGRVWLAAPVEKFVSEVAEREFTALIEALNFGAFADLAVKLLNRLGACILDVNPDNRRRAVQLATRLIGESAGEARTLVVSRLREPLQTGLVKEADAEALRAHVEAIRTWVGVVVKGGGRLVVIAEFFSAGIKAKLDADDVPRDFKVALLNKVRAIQELLGPVIDAVRTGPAQLRQAANKIAVVIGPPLIGPMIELITTSDNPDVRRSAAQTLREIGGSASADLAKLVRSDSPGDVVRRVVSVLDIASSGNLATSVFQALAHGDAQVHEAAFALLKRIDRAMSIAILRKTLSMEKAQIVMESLHLVKEMKFAELLPEAVRIATTTLDEAIARSTCAFLGECPNPSSVPALRRIFANRGGLFKKGFADETRAAAITAAGRIPHLSARELIAEAKKDRSDAVRRSAGA